MESLDGVWPSFSLLVASWDVAAGYCCRALQCVQERLFLPASALFLAWRTGRMWWADAAYFLSICQQPTQVSAVSAAVPPLPGRVVGASRACCMSVRLCPRPLTDPTCHPERLQLADLWGHVCAGWGTARHRRHQSGITST